jgi:2,4-diaminopentanoate dehydrogenase
MDVVVWGFGKLGRLAAEAAELTAGLTLVGVITARPAAVAGQVGAHVDLLRDLDETRERHPDAFVVHAGHALDDELVDLLEQCARRGLDIVTSSGFFHPRTQFPDRASGLDELAKSTGARVVAAGVHPGFFFDVLPATVIPIAAGWRTVEVRKTSSAGSWPRDVRHMQGIGEAPAMLAAELPYPLAASARLLVEAVGGVVASIVESRSAVTRDFPIRLDDEVIVPGLSTGYRQVCRATLKDSRVVTLTWEVFVDDPLDPIRDLAFRINVAGGPVAGIQVTVDGDFTSDPYPATVERMLHVASAVRRLPPGVHVVTDAGISRSE